MRRVLSSANCVYRFLTGHFGRPLLALISAWNLWAEYRSQKAGSKIPPVFSTPFSELLALIITVQRTKEISAMTPEPNVNSKLVKQELTLIPLGIALNLAIGGLVFALKLPVYLDAVGTIIITIIAGVRAGIAVGVLSFLIGGLLFNPVLPYFCGTQAAIAIYTHLVAKRGGFRNIGWTILSGIGLGVVAGIVSAPVIVALFGGVTGSGASLVVAFLLKAGEGLYKSVLLSGLASEPLDKTLQCLLAFFLLRGLPKTVLGHFRSGSLEKNINLPQ
jgi:energy-coupling factor transport system substrate-specific component